MLVMVEVVVMVLYEQRWWCYFYSDGQREYGEKKYGYRYR